ncbi:MAG: phosphohydrolase [Acidobacteria bacterium]|nr:phosphohydrolase [Acidobacteriota bacterium]
MIRVNTKLNKQQTETKKTDWIQTYTGKKFYPLEPDPDQICIEDIAHSLAMLCRYNGHTKQFYSVAQHCVILSQKFFNSRHMRLAALLHDASEAYLSDLPRPLKHLPQFAFYREAEDQLQSMILQKFNISLTDVQQKLIELFDHEMIYHEAASPALMHPTHADWQMPLNKSNLRFDISPWGPSGAETVFLMVFYNLTQNKEAATNA